jgi:dihydropteroate synthase
MGVVNVTPDSFSDGGRFFCADAAIAHGLKLIAEGADLLDIGGESTRPGADAVSVDDEIARIVPVITGLRAVTDRPISIDTRKAIVAEAAINAGASLWNDVTALSDDPAALATAARLGVPVILMHMQGEPQTMQADPRYGDVVAEVCAYLAERARLAMAAGVARAAIRLDPGIGFGKTLEHNLALLSHIDALVGLGFPVVLGVSRKRFIQGLDPSATEPTDRLGGSIAAALAGAQAGVDMLRVHDVAQTAQALAVWQAIEAGRA